MIGVAELFTLRIFFHRDRLVRFAVGAKLDVRQAFAMTVAWMRGRGPVVDRMLTELPGRKFGWFLLRGGQKKRAAQRDDSYRHATRVSNIRSARGDFDHNRRLLCGGARATVSRHPRAQS